MQNEKWHDPSEKVLNAKYIVLSLSATVLLVLGVIGYLLPDLLSILGQQATNSIQENWFLFVGVGVAIGAINAFTTLFAKKKAKPKI